MKRMLFIMLLFTASVSAGNTRFITLATTTSTDNSGLLGYLHPEFTKDTGIDVHVIALGTGAALELARRGDADVVMVHCRYAEDEFVRNEDGSKRYPLMHNDFVLVGPPNDPAGISGKKAHEALERIAASKALFVSRGDNSGTYMKEMALWGNRKIDPGSGWYLSSGQGMGKTLVMADEKKAYTLTDRGTFLAFQDKLDLKILCSGGPELMNPYSVIPVNSQKHPHVKSKLVRIYVNWLLSPKGQKMIADFKAHGQQLFFPDGSGVEK